MDIRKYYLDATGHWLPTAKGIWLPIEDVDGNTAKHILKTVLEGLESFKGV